LVSIHKRIIQYARIVHNSQYVFGAGFGVFGPWVTPYCMHCSQCDSMMAQRYVLDFRTPGGAIGNFALNKRLVGSLKFVAQ